MAQRLMGRLLCLLGIHAAGRVVREGYNALGETYEPGHVPRWVMQSCERCGHVMVWSR